MKTYYDTIIVGAGPAGLTLAQCLRHDGGSILLVDGIEAIGGCHRVVRVPYEDQMLFTEHGPRVYFNNYKNFQTLLKDMGHDFYSLFTPYRYSVQSESIRMFEFSFREIFHLFFAFLLFLWDEDYGKKSTIQQFGKKHHFTAKTMDTLDRISRMTDGAGSDRFTINQFFQTVNQQAFYKIYQPNKPNDKGLLYQWEEFLRKQSNIDIVLDHNVVHLSYNKKLNSIHSLWVLDKKKHNTIEIKCGRVILAIPPHAVAHVFRTCHQNVQDSFMPYQKLQKFVKNTDYITYISITYHWKTIQKIPARHGFPTGEWGITYIVLSDYMDMTDEYSKTLISCCVSYMDKPSHNTGKTANQSSSEEIVEEVFFQLKSVMPLVANPDVALISPQNSYETGKWKQYDVSYFPSIKEKPFPNHGSIKNLFNAGAQNGNSPYSFTTLETAVSNALVLAYKLDPKTKEYYPFQELWTLRQVLKIVLFIIIILIFLIVFMTTTVSKKKKKKKNK